MTEHFSETGVSDPEYDSDDSYDDPSYAPLEETHAKLSNRSIKKTKSKTRIVEVIDDEEGLDGVEVVVPELNQIDAKSYEHVHKIIQDKEIEKLKLDQCKLYLRKNGLRLTGNKDTLIHRIKEHLEILNGGGEKKYPAYSFVLNCKGDACTGDVVMFEQNVYDMFDIASRRGKSPPCGTRVVAGRIVKESYGAAKQQHTFTIEVLWCKGEKPLPPLHPLLIKGRNLYRLKTLRQRWEDEGERQKALMEKHLRGSLARSEREARVQKKEMRKTLRTNRVSRKEEPIKKQPRVNSTSTFNTSVQPHQSYPLVNLANLHQSVGPGNTKMGTHLGLSTDPAKDPPAKPATLTHHFKKPATQPQDPQSCLMTVDHGKLTSQPQGKQHSLMQDWYVSQASQRQPLTSVNHCPLTSTQPRDPQSCLMTVDHGKLASQPQVKQHLLMQDWYLSQASQRQPLTSVNHCPLTSTQPRDPQSCLMTVDHGKLASQPQVKQHSLMQDWYLSQASQRQPLTSVNHSLLTSTQAQKQVCRHFAQGRCYYGGNCKFSHEMRENQSEKMEKRQQLCNYGDSYKYPHKENYYERRFYNPNL